MVLYGMDLLDADSECVQCNWCDTQFALLGVETLGLHITRKKKLNNVDKSKEKRNQQKHEMRSILLRTNTIFVLTAHRLQTFRTKRTDKV